MEVERFRELMEMNFWNDRTKDGLIQGILLMRKYVPDVNIDGAGHDVVFSSVSENELAPLMSEEDVIALNKTGWHNSDEYGCIAHFV